MKKILLYTVGLFIITQSVFAQEVRYYQPDRTRIVYGGRHYVLDEKQHVKAAPSKKTSFTAKPYIGLDYVYSNADIDNSNVLEDSFNAGAVSVGARLHKNFGFEAFYQQSEEGEKNTALQDLGIKTTDKYKAYGVDLIGYLPLTNNLDALMSFGMAYYDVEYSLKIYDAFGEINGDDSGWGYRLGFGVQYNFSEHWSARLMGRYTSVDIDGVDTILDFTAGVRYHF